MFFSRHLYVESPLPLRGRSVDERAELVGVPEVHREHELGQGPREGEEVRPGGVGDPELEVQREGRRQELRNAHLPTLHIMQ